MREVLGRDVTKSDMAQAYPSTSPPHPSRRVLTTNCWTTPAQTINLARLALRIKPQRDLQFDYLACKPCTTAISRVRKTRIELPQAFFMRVAMGLSLNGQTQKPAPLSSMKCSPVSTEHAHALQQRFAAPATVQLGYLTTVA